MNIREKETNIVVDTSLFSFDVPVGDLKKGNLIEVVARQGPSLNKGSSILRFK